uniref:Transposase Tc1-like domain-containing protein n=1 Tax=Xenopus tropicalis TaxID=8364 RepID=A0A803JD42_XENTR
MGKKGDLSNSERGMVVGARRAGLSISQSAQLLGFSRTTISRVYKEWWEKGKTSSMRQSCGRKCLVDARGQRRMGRLIQADRRQQSICEATTRTALRRMGYNSRRPDRVPLISITNRKKRLQFNMDPLCLGGVGDVFLAHFRPLSANWASFKCHGLPDTSSAISPWRHYQFRQLNPSAEVRSCYLVTGLLFC